MIRPLSGGEPLRLEPLKLGERIRDIRRRHSWTLEEASRRTGLARSTLSKIENEQMSPTFEVVQKLAAGLEIELPQLFEATAAGGATGRRTITRQGEGRPRVTATYEHELLSVELAQRKMVPFKTRVRARSFDSFSDWVRHSGEEFLYVLEGRIAFYTEFYEPVVLAAGDSVYYDSDMGHACVSVSDDDALILWVSTA
ncbi:MAG: helix-turn-helix transcriptional regulator [Rhodospirillales bacterium]|nr:MAG: helix-turn-helix transcriptional regulator [Rhodospirillales bacterium]